MIQLSHVRCPAAWLAVLVLMTGGTSCRKAGKTEDGGVERSVVIDTRLRYNRASDYSSAVYQSQAGSPIHWQPWSKETLEMARKSQRLLFVVVALPQQPSFLTVLQDLAASPTVVASLNHEYVPVLLDADAAREIGLVLPVLCTEINQPLQLPILMWMTYQGDPVGWIPAQSHGGKGTVGLFDHSHGMISRMWRDDSDYVLRNSALDNGNRRSRLQKRMHEMAFSEIPEEDVIRALRKLTSLYDSSTRSFDEVGGLFPFGALELLSVAARHPGIPSELRGKCGLILREVLQDLLPSAMFDPLGGGMFTSRRGPSWALPSFQQDCMSHARAVGVLIEAWHSNGDAFALARARSVLRFAEGRYKTPDGLFAIGLEPPGEQEDWMWTQEEIKELLPAEQAEWWIRESRIKGLGNLPSESDPRREYFRSNTLALGNPSADQAGAADAFPAFFDSSRQKLLEKRESRLPKSFVDHSPHAGASFRMVSAYASMFTVSADEEFRRKAVELLRASRETFTQGRYLRSMKGEAADEISLARGFLYALALQAALDVAAITGDQEWLVWAEDLSTLSAEQFTGDGLLKECPDVAQVLNLPIADITMLFDDSTAGLYSMCAMRLAALQRPMVDSFRQLAVRLPTYASNRPVLHTDLLLSAMQRHFTVKVTAMGSLPEPLAAGVRTLALRGVLRAVEEAEEGEEGLVKVSWPGGQERTVRTAEELRALMDEIRR